MFELGWKLDYCRLSGAISSRFYKPYRRDEDNEWYGLEAKDYVILQSAISVRPDDSSKYGYTQRSTLFAILPKQHTELIKNTAGERLYG